MTPVRGVLSLCTRLGRQSSSRITFYGYLQATSLQGPCSAFHMALRFEEHRRREASRVGSGCRIRQFPGKSPRINERGVSVSRRLDGFASDCGLPKLLAEALNCLYPSSDQHWTYAQTIAATVVSVRRCDQTPRYEPCDDLFDSNNVTKCGRWL